MNTGISDPTVVRCGGDEKDIVGSDRCERGENIRTGVTHYSGKRI